MLTIDSKFSLNVTYSKYLNLNLLEGIDLVKQTMLKFFGCFFDHLPSFVDNFYLIRVEIFHCLPTSRFTLKTTPYEQSNFYTRPCQAGLEAAFQVPMPGDSGSSPDAGSISNYFLTLKIFTPIPADCCPIISLKQ